MNLSLFLLFKITLGRCQTCQRFRRHLVKGLVSVHFRDLREFIRCEAEVEDLRIGPDYQEHVMQQPFRFCDMIYLEGEADNQNTFFILRAV